MRSHIFLPTIPVCRTRAVEVSKATDHGDVGLMRKNRKAHPHSRQCSPAHRRLATRRPQSLCSNDGASIAKVEPLD
jgi:hypothetical protein